MNEFGHKLRFALLDKQRNQIEARIPFVASAQYVRVLSDVGTLQLRVTGTAIRSISAENLPGYYIRVDFGVDFIGIGTHTQDGVYIIKNVIRAKEPNGPDYIDITAYDYNILLDNRLVAYRGETAQTVKDDTADNIMKALVRENIGSSSTTDYDGNAITTRNYTGLQVDSDTSSGPTLTMTGIEWQSVLSVLQEAQAASAVAGLETYFGMIPNGTNGPPRFRTAVSLWGKDLAGSVFFSSSNGTLLNPSIVYQWRNAASVAYVGESGEPAERIINTVNSSNISVSGDTRREVWVNGGRIDPESGDITTQLRLMARNELARQRPYLLQSGAILSNRRAPYKFSYGNVQGWDLGDSVTCVIDTSGRITRFVAVIRAVQVTMREDGHVGVAARVESFQLL